MYLTACDFFLTKESTSFKSASAWWLIASNIGRDYPSISATLANYIYMWHDIEMNEDHNLLYLHVE